MTRFILAAMSGALVMAIAAAIRPDTDITINGLTYSGGIMRQDRTVRGVAPLVAKWRAEVLDAGSGLAVCGGAGQWDYTPGRKVADLLLDEWVGDPGCLSRLAPDATYQGCAVYTWADSQREDKCSPAFRGDDFGASVHSAGQS